MNTDRVQACLQLLEVLHGGTPPAQERLMGLTQDERLAAESLFAATPSARRAYDDARAHDWAVLAAAERDSDGSR